MHIIQTHISICRTNYLLIIDYANYGYTALFYSIGLGYIYFSIYLFIRCFRSDLKGSRGLEEVSGTFQDGSSDISEGF